MKRNIYMEHPVFLLYWVFKKFGSFDGWTNTMRNTGAANADLDSPIKEAVEIIEKYGTHKPYHHYRCHTPNTKVQ